ncbi:semaphorin-1A-like isoform X2 [Artemia franciscana]|uniref:Semaphorin-1A n=1 Tax=Artemia franciscana TaxID=6661 RepID=A0AA88I033_ARTSF|nr:hypothetical protein QYM36_006041 [Artemia franciscana]
MAVLKKSLVIVQILIVGLFATWQEELRPKHFVTYEENEVARFLGNRSHPDFFKLLEADGDSILVGARNIVYNISLPDLIENEDKRILWQPISSHREICAIKGKSEDDCQNYIRILAKTKDDRLLVCGTNAYNPLCRYYTDEDGVFIKSQEVSGKGLCPYDPRHNSTALYTDGELYVATVSDFSTADPLIYREPLRTDQYDLKQLNAPSFVGSLADSDYVYYFMRETAVEYINCGKAVYSRVARVCKKDRGGSHKFANRWTSFLKARLNCSVPGEYPFYFDEIQSVSEIIEGSYGKATRQIIYAVFTTPENSIKGSAVCAFDLENLKATFEGAFKEQESMNSNWLPMPQQRVPEPRPGVCANDSRTLPDQNLNFVKSHCLMDEAVPSMHGQPILVKTSLGSRYMKIVIDPQVQALDGKAYDIMFIGTDNGKVIRSINVAGPETSFKVQPVILEEMQLFPNNVPITNLKIVASPVAGDSKLIAVTDDEIQAIPLHRCHSNKITTCSECVALQDPYCGWHLVLKKCVPVTHYKNTKPGMFVQAIASGKSDLCPAEISNAIPVDLSNVSTEPSTVLPEPVCPTCGPCVCPEVTHVTTILPSTTNQPEINGKRPDLSVDIESNVIEEVIIPYKRPGYEYEYKFEDNTIDPVPKVGASSLGSPPVYTAETFTVAVVTSCFVALIVGFIAGLLFSRKCRSEYGATHYLENRKHLRRCLESDNPYIPPSKMNNLINNQVSKNANEKNANMSTLEKSTLQKVKKTYV